MTPVDSCVCGHSTHAHRYGNGHCQMNGCSCRGFCAPLPLMGDDNAAWPSGVLRPFPDCILCYLNEIAALNQRDWCGCVGGIWPEELDAAYVEVDGHIAAFHTGDGHVVFVRDRPAAPIQVDGWSGAFWKLPRGSRVNMDPDGQAVHWIVDRDLWFSAWSPHD